MVPPHGGGGQRFSVARQRTTDSQLIPDVSPFPVSVAVIAFAPSLSLCIPCPLSFTLPLMLSVWLALPPSLPLAVSLSLTPFISVSSFYVPPFNLPDSLPVSLTLYLS